MTIRPAQPPVVTVFGGTGFLGRHIIAQLARTGAVIRVATRNPAHAYFLRPLGHAGQIVPVRCDIADDASVAAALDRSTHAVNLVGCLYETRDCKFDRLHTELPGRLGRLAAARKLSLLVHVSALGAANNSPSRFARSKAAGEDALRDAFPRHVILRPGAVFGPEDDFLNAIARMARRFGALPVLDGGRTRFQPVYVGDIARAVTEIVTAPPAAFAGNTYALAGPEVYTFRELAGITLHHARLHARLVPWPFWLARLIGKMANVMPTSVVAAQQIRRLYADDVQAPGTAGLAELGIAPTHLQAVLPTYMAQYWPGGRYTEFA